MSAERVTIVDDDLSVRRALLRLVRSAGYEAIAFASGTAVLESSCAERPDCLVVDVRLGGMTGFELVDRLRRDGVTAPVVFITAHDDEATRSEARRLGAAGYLRKPFAGVALLDAVAAALRAAEVRSGW